MPNFFGEHSPFLAHPLLTPERTSTEVDAIESILALAPTGPVLDMGCGFGRHALELARRGYRVTGVDTSPAMLAAAGAAAAEAGLDVSLSTTLGGRRSTFDGAICMFTSLGQVDDDGRDNRWLAQDMADALRPGGSLLVEVPQRAPAVDALNTTETFGAGDNRTEIRRRYEPSDHRIVEEFLVVDDGRQRAFGLEYHLFSADELIDLLGEAGLVEVRLAADLQRLEAGTVLTPSDPTMVAIARRPG